MVDDYNWIFNYITKSVASKQYSPNFTQRLNEKIEDITPKKNFDMLIVEICNKLKNEAKNKSEAQSFISRLKTANRNRKQRDNNRQQNLISKTVWIPAERENEFNSYVYDLKKSSMTLGVTRNL